MCLSGNSMPAPIKYAKVKSPNAEVGASQRTEARRRAAATANKYAGDKGPLAQPALALKKALGA